MKDLFTHLNQMSERELLRELQRSHQAMQQSEDVSDKKANQYGWNSWYQIVPIVGGSAQIAGQVLVAILSPENEWIAKALSSSELLFKGSHGVLDARGNRQISVQTHKGEEITRILQLVDAALSRKQRQQDSLEELARQLVASIASALKQ